MSHKSIAEGATQLADSKLFMEAMMSEMRRVMRLELEQVRKRIDRMETTRVQRPQHAPNMYRRERVQPKHVAEDFEEFNEGSFREKDDRQLVGSVRRFGCVRRDRNREDNNLGSNTRPSHNPSTSAWHAHPWKKDEKQINPRPKAEQKQEEVSHRNQGKSDSSITRNHDIKCFTCQGRGDIANQCPNKRAMVMRDNGVIETDDDSDHESMPSLEDADDEEYAVQGDLLVARRALSVQAREDEEKQRETSSILGALSKTSGEKRVNKQVLVSFRIGRYEDEVLCDVVPMQAGQLLPGMPWQFDRRVKHDGFTNKYSFVHNQRTDTLVPLTPKQVYEDQVSLQRESEKKKMSEEKSRVGVRRESTASERKKEEEAEKKESKREKSEITEKKKQQAHERNAERKTNFYARGSEIKRAMFLNQEMIVLLYKKELLNTNEHNPALPSSAVSLLQELEDVFSDEVPNGLPPIRGIEHQIDFLPSTSNPNRPACRSNLERTKELQRQKDAGDDLGTNRFQEEGNDENVISGKSTWDETYSDPILVPIGPVTRARAKKFKNALMRLIRASWSQAIAWRPIEGITSVNQPNKCVIQVIDETE